MLAVKKLCDLQRAILHADSGRDTLRRRGPGALHLVAIEPADSDSSPHTPKMLTFQDSELSAELQTAMSSHYGGCEEGLAIKNAVGMSQSQESIDCRSRGSGRSQDPPTGLHHPPQLVAGEPGRRLGQGEEPPRGLGPEAPAAAAAQAGSSGHGHGVQVPRHPGQAPPVGVSWPLPSWLTGTEGFQLPSFSLWLHGTELLPPPCGPHRHPGSAQETHPEHDPLRPVGRRAGRRR